jgi:stage II sporulation protein D
MLKMIAHMTQRTDSIDSQENAPIWRVLCRGQSRTLRRSRQEKYALFSSPCFLMIFLIISVVTALSSSFAAPPVRGDLSDVLKSLYTHQITSTERGEPLISIGVSDQQKRVLIESKSGVIAYLGGHRDLSIKPSHPKTQWRVVLKDVKLGRALYWCVGEVLDSNEDISAREAYWREQGHPVKRLEAGGQLSVEGRTLDTRKISLVMGGFENKSDAEKLSLQLEELDGLRHPMIEELEERPTGLLKATYRSKSQKGAVSSRDVLWFSPAGKEPLQVTTWARKKHGRKKHGRKKRDKKKRAQLKKQVNLYDGDLYLAVGVEGGIEVVNVLNAERILEGVVPTEQYTSAPMDALKAQAIAARGQLISKLGHRHRADPFLLCNTVHCQGYSGRQRLHPRSSEAVLSTKGMLAIDRAGALIDTVYSSTCGGHTEAYHEVWGGAPKPALMGVVDSSIQQLNSISEDRLEVYLSMPPISYCEKPKSTFRWKVTRTSASINETIQKRKQIGEIVRIEVIHRGVSGRVIEVKYHGLKGTLNVRGEYANRKLLGKLKSGLWKVEREGGAFGAPPKQWHFTGGGYGHGVGMCQHGSIGMAKAGATFESIISHYYRGAQLKTFW